jgi:hypothetical protein
MITNPPAPLPTRPDDLLAEAESVIEAAALSNEFRAGARLEQALAGCIARLRVAAQLEEERRKATGPVTAYVEEMMTAVGRTARAAERAGPEAQGELRQTLKDLLARLDMGNWKRAATHRADGEV